MPRTCIVRFSGDRAYDDDDIVRRRGRERKSHRNFAADRERIRPVNEMQERREEPEVDQIDVADIPGRNREEHGFAGMHDRTVDGFGYRENRIPKGDDGRI